MESVGWAQPLANVLSTALGAAIALVASLLTARKNADVQSVAAARAAENERIERLAAKGEELFGLVENYAKTLTSQFILERALQRRTMDLDDVNHAISELAGEAPADWVKIPLLIAVYFPESEAKWKAMVQARDSFSRIFEETKSWSTFRQGPGPTGAQDAVMRIDRAAEEIKHQIVESLRSAEVQRAQLYTPPQARPILTR